jgi:hypothetical protein
MANIEEAVSADKEKLYKIHVCIAMLYDVIHFW